MPQAKTSKAATRLDRPASDAPESGLVFTGERIVPEADNCEPNFASRMYQEHIARYLFASQVTHGKSVIDIGCGVGYGSQRLAELGARSVYAFDLSEIAIRHAQIHYSHANLKYESANAEEFTTEQQFDVAICFELIEHVKHPRKVLANIQRALKPDGILVMSTPRALEQKRTHFHEHEFSLDEYVSMIRDYFPNVEMYVENNHFASLVTKARPTTVSRIECLKEQFEPSVADVFIAVATSSDKQLPPLDPALALDNDAYVTMLERDVEILHKAEADFLEGAKAKDQEIRRLEGEYRTLFQRNEELSSKLWASEQQSEAKEAEIKRLTAENQTLRSLQNRLQELEMKVSELEKERESLRQEVAWLTVRSADAEARRLDAYEFARVSSQETQGLRREIEILRRDISEALDRPLPLLREAPDQRHRDVVDAMERLFLGTEATHHIAEDPLIERVRRMSLELDQRRGEVETLAREVEALREFQQHAEEWHNQLLRIRKSVSWRITKPVRAMAKPFRRSRAR